MKIEENFVDTSKVYIKEIQKDIGKDMIVKNHYSHTWSKCSHALGVFYKTENDHKHFDEKEEILIGCLIYGNPVGRSAAASISDLVGPETVLELVRLFIYDGYGKNIESYCISQSFKWLKRNRPDIIALISYADVEQNHRGGIYQATSWVYQGNSATALMPNYSISLTKDPYKWLHSRTVSDKWSSHNVEHLRKVVGQPFYRRRESTKHRYLYFLCDKIAKKKILKSMKHPALPYPKECSYDEKVEYYEPIETEKQEVFFEF